MTSRLEDAARQGERVQQHQALSREWMSQGLCVTSGNPDLWFPEKGEWKAGRAAKAMCAGCPVRAECLAYARALGIQHGIWGGTSPDERNGRRARRSHKPGPDARQRKTEAERRRRRRLREAAAAGDPGAAERLERERARKRSRSALPAAREQTQEKRTAS